jgi:hypothetical protein
LGILSQRWSWIDSPDFGYPAADGADLRGKRVQKTTVTIIIRRMYK